MLIYYECGQRGLGPRIYGALDGGRLEEFIPSHTLTTNEVQEPEVQRQLMRKLVRFHHLQVPVSNKRIDMLEVPAERYLELDSPAGRTYSRKVCDYHGKNFEEYVFDWRSEIAWLRSLIPRSRAPTSSRSTT